MTVAQASESDRWAAVSFREVLAEPVRNGVYKPAEFHGRGYPIVNMGEIFGYDFITDQPEKRIDLTDEEISKSALEDGDLLFARRSFVLEGAGKCSIVLAPVERMTFESSLIRARVDKRVADPLFYYYLFRSQTGRDLMASIAVRTAVSGITGQDLMRVTVPFPELAAQSVIARLLKRYDDLILLNERRSKVLDELLRCVFQQWLDASTSTQETSGAQAMERLGDVADIVMGQSPRSEHYNSKGEGLPFHQGVKDFGRRFPMTRVYCTAPGRIAEHDDILFSVRAPVGRINVADRKLVLGRGLAGIRSKSGRQAFLLQALQTKFHSDDLMGGGTVFQAVTRRDVEQIEVPCQTCDVADRFERFATPIWRSLEALAWQTQSLAKMRDFLLPRLLLGSVRFDIAAAASKVAS